ncbi:adenosine receptor A2a-like [Montipora capricornis]|uniref:adenosine receptor A2a-like n=1 Tax=Montipora capricornis TaxID=246305 RepID=UPI0035F134E1
MANSTSNHTLSSSRGILTEPLDTWYWIIRGIIAVLTITGNCLIIYFITCRRHLRVTSNWFVLSLAIADFCIGLFVTLSEFACKFYFRCDWYLQIVFYNFLLFSSTTNLWAMAIDRYIGIVHSLRYASLVTSKRVIAMVAIAWSSTFAATFVRLLWFQNDHFQQKIEKYYRVAVDVLFGIVSCLLLIFIYLRIVFISRKVSKQITTQAVDINHNYKPKELKFRSRHRRQNLSTSLIGSVILLLVLCNSLSISSSFCFTYRLCSIEPVLMKVAYLLVHLNSSVNFVVYALIKKDIRLDIKRMFRCRNSVEPPQTTFSIVENIP